MARPVPETPAAIHELRDGRRFHDGGVVECKSNEIPPFFLGSRSPLGETLKQGLAGGPVLADELEAAVDQRDRHAHRVEAQELQQARVGNLDPHHTHTLSKETPMSTVTRPAVKHVGKISTIVATDDPSGCAYYVKLAHYNPLELWLGRDGLLGLPVKPEIGGVAQVGDIFVEFENGAQVVVGHEHALDVFAAAKVDYEAAKEEGYNEGYDAGWDAGYDRGVDSVDVGETAEVDVKDLLRRALGETVLGELDTHVEFGDMTDEDLDYIRKNAEPDAGPVFLSQRRLVDEMFAQALRQGFIGIRLL